MKVKNTKELKPLKYSKRKQKMFRKSFVTLYHTLPVLSQKARYWEGADKLKMHAHAIESRADILV